VVEADREGSLRRRGTHPGPLVCGGARGGEEKWKPAPSPLMTRFAEEVSPKEIPTFEFYARPMLSRDSAGRNLLGLWDFCVTESFVKEPLSEYQGKIMVPYPIESALSGVKRTIGANEKLWYHLACPIEWGTDWLKSANSRLMLRFDGVNYGATVFVNGKELGSHRGGNDAFSFDISGLIKEKGKQTLDIAVAVTPGGPGGA